MAAAARERPLWVKEMGNVGWAGGLCVSLALL